MLSIEECRRLLGSPRLSDAEVAEIRDTLQAFAATLVDGFVEKHAGAHRTPAEERSQKP